MRKTEHNETSCADPECFSRDPVGTGRDEANNLSLYDIRPDGHPGSHLNPHGKTAGCSAKENKKIRNIAIIAHVDHGKTTLVDLMLRQSGVFRQNQEVSERVMDNLDLEKERGITIAAKNCSIWWKDVRINIIDTPGHADFGGEVERSLSMVQGAILLVDAAEGPLPQTRFVLRKALESGLKMIVVINKIDRKDARPKEVLDEIYNLFIDLEATEKGLDFPVLYAVGRDGIAQKILEEPGKDLTVLFDTILTTVPAPTYHPSEPFQMLVADLDYSDYVGQLAIGRVFNGSARCNDNLVCIKEDGKTIPLRVTKLQVYNGISIELVDEVQPGDIIILAGIENVAIGDTICTESVPKSLPRIKVDEPTVSMTFTMNTSPFAGEEGTFIQSRKILERLRRETLLNVGIQLEESSDPVGDSDTYIVKGRGEFQMEILLETIRREGYEVSVGRPQVIFKKKDGLTLEPIEHLYVDCDEAHIGTITEKISQRKGQMINMVNHGTGRVRLEFTIPTRCLIGYRNEFLTDTRGTGIMSSYLKGYEEYRGEFKSRLTGSLVADRKGTAAPYALENLEARGSLFIKPGDRVYEGMIVGEYSRDGDLNVNAAKGKKLTNMRSSTCDDNIILKPVLPMTLGKAITFIRDDEMVEVTSKSIRLRKKILSSNARKSQRVRSQSSSASREGKRS
ncbi:MAG: translational GTPase TypA [Planctomycetota bacterium]|nr:translational GTPase TypA [Planctomycetota bacterium]MDI6787525.1 translational GTPase TypA [Planctomycetota bacterium]